MADRLSLSYWIRGFQTSNMLRSFEKMLRLFPASQLSGGQSTLRVSAISFREPPVLEREFNDPLELDQLLPVLREYSAPDNGYEVMAKWDLWQYENKDWRLMPTPATLMCFGPDFEADMGENLRIDFGLDSNFLPQPEIRGSVSLIQSNIKSLLRLVHDLDRAFPVEKRLLWTETGENFVERLQEALEEADLRAAENE